MGARGRRARGGGDPAHEHGPRRDQGRLRPRADDRGRRRPSASRSSPRAGPGSSTTSWRASRRARTRCSAPSIFHYGEYRVRGGQGAPRRGGNRRAAVEPEPRGSPTCRPARRAAARPAAHGTPRRRVRRRRGRAPRRRGGPRPAAGTRGADGPRRRRRGRRAAGGPRGGRSALGGEVREHDRFGTATVVGGGPASSTSSRPASEPYPQPGALPEVRAGLARRGPGAARLHRQRDRHRPARAELGQRCARTRARSTTSTPGRLRVLHAGSFLDDPTRLLRLVRYARPAGASRPTRAPTRWPATPSPAGALGAVSGGRVGGELRLLAAEPTALGGPDPRAGARPRPRAAPELRHPGSTSPSAALSAGVDARRDLLVLAACCTRFERDELDGVAGPAGVPRCRARGGRGGRAGRARRWPSASSTPTAASEIRHLALGRPAEEIAMAAALGAGDAGASGGSASCATRSLEITGDDLLAAGVPEGPRVGRGLDAAWAALLDEGASDREAQLAAALAAPRRIASAPDGAIRTRCSGTAGPGHYEVYYLSATDRGSGCGLWIRYTMVAPLDGDGRPARCGSWRWTRATAASSGASTPGPAAELTATADPFELRIGDAVLTDRGMTGGFEDVAGTCAGSRACRRPSTCTRCCARPGWPRPILVLPHPAFEVAGNGRASPARTIELDGRPRRPGPPVGLQARRPLGVGALQRLRGARRLAPPRRLDRRRVGVRPALRPRDRAQHAGGRALRRARTSPRPARSA